MAHWQDIGGQLGGVTRDIFSEGLQMPFVKHFRAGVENPEITAIIKANVRVPGARDGRHARPARVDPHRRAAAPAIA